MFKKLIILSLILILTNCSAPTALLGPSLTVARTGNIYQAGLSYGSGQMIKKAKENYPKCKFTHGDALKSITFQPNTFTHITVMYFTIYSIKDKIQFFQNCYSWLRPGGWLVLHLVDRDSFDPILPVADVFSGGLDPQKYSKERIMQTKASFNNHDYKAVFSIDNDKDISYLDETFQHKKNGEVRRNKHVLYMPSQKQILSKARSAGFILSSHSEMKKIGYANQYIYVLQKPE